MKSPNAPNTNTTLLPGRELRAFRTPCCITGSAIWVVEIPPRNIVPLLSLRPRRIVDNYNVHICLTYGQSDYRTSAVLELRNIAVEVGNVPMVAPGLFEEVLIAIIVPPLTPSQFPAPIRTSPTATLE